MNKAEHNLEYHNIIETSTSLEDILNAVESEARQAGCNSNTWETFAVGYLAATLARKNRRNDYV